MMVRAVLRLPAISSRRAYAIQPWGFFGLELTMLLDKVRARLMSLTSALEFTCIAQTVGTGNKHGSHLVYAHVKSASRLIACACAEDAMWLWISCIEDKHARKP
jgi:hypothetical protein